MPGKPDVLRKSVNTAFTADSIPAANPKKAEHSAEKRLCLEKDIRSENNNLSARPEVEPSSTNCLLDHDNPIEKENSMSEDLL